MRTLHPWTHKRGVWKKDEGESSLWAEENGKQVSRFPDKWAQDAFCINGQDLFIVSKGRLKYLTEGNINASFLYSRKRLRKLLST